MVLQLTLPFDWTTYAVTTSDSFGRISRCRLFKLLYLIMHII